MKKRFIFFAAILTIFTVLTVTACGTVASGKDARDNLSAALEAMDQYYAFDLSMTVKASGAGETAEANMQLAVIDNGETQEAHIYMDEGLEYKTDLYFSQGYAFDDQGNGNFSAYPTTLDKLMDSNEAAPTSIDMDLLGSNLSVTQTKDSKFDKYTLKANNTQLGEMFGELFDGMNFSGNFVLNVWQDRNSNIIKKMEYSLNFKIEKEKFRVKVSVVINAVNDAVSINFPDYIAAEINKYKNMPTLILKTGPEDCGSVYGAGKYKEGEYVYIYAYENYGYAFDGWYQDGELVSDYYCYSFIMPAGDLTLAARFVHQYYVQTTAEPYNCGNVWNYYGSAKEGDTITVSASPSVGFIFFGWYEDGVRVSGDKEYTFIMPARDRSLVAKFGQYIEDYQNTADGVVKYYDLGSYKNAVYDSKTDKFVVLRDNSVEIYSADMTKEKTLSFLINPAAIDADNGILAIGFGDAMQVHLYDLADSSEIKKIQTAINVHELVMDGDMIIYTDNNQWCSLVFYSIYQNRIVRQSSRGAYQPLLSLNRADHVLYVTETGVSPSSLTYYDTRTGEYLFQSEHGQFDYNYKRVLFDGKYVHYLGKVYDRVTGEMHASIDLNRHYNGLQNFDAVGTLYDSDNLAFVFGTHHAYPYVGVYDNNSDKYVYRFNYAAASLEYMGAGKYFARNISNSHIAVIDTSFIPAGFDGNIPPTLDKSNVTQSDRIKTLKHFENYTASATDGEYIYLINESSYKLCVYDVVTLEEVYSERFMVTPVCLDAYGGKLAVGFGDARQLRFYDTSDWSCTNVRANDCVWSLAIYNDKIIYMPVDQHCNLHIYSMTKKIHTLSDGYYSAYYPTIAINREDGILYIGSRNSSSDDLVYVDLSDNSIIYNSSFGQYVYNKTVISFDGEFVHYNGKILDKKTAMIISMTEKARTYDNTDGYSELRTVYDDGLVSVFTAKYASVIYTVFYDFTTNTIIGRVEGGAASVIKTVHGYVLFNNSTDNVKIFTL